jgi:hypothetical protein
MRRLIVQQVVEIAGTVVAEPEKRRAADRR